MKFKVSGTIKLKKEKPFNRFVEAENENMAKHKIFSFFGNVYRIPRTKIKIKEVKKIE